MRSVINDTWFLERNLISDGFDRAIDRLRAELPFTVHEYPSGTEAWTWIVPDKWTCQEAYVERLKGERVIDYKTHPLHCACYSAPFEGVVSREDLLRHLEVHSRVRDAIAYSWRYYQTDWGLACTADQRDALTDEFYRVVIRTERVPGRLKVAELFLEGDVEDRIILCAHLCHPCQVNDGLTGVVAGLEVFRELQKRPARRYGYHLLITPETIGSIAWLSRHEDLIPKAKGGLFLEMLGTDCPHALQMSFDGNTVVDRCFRSALREVDPAGWFAPFRRVIGNDERQFNAPGVRIPMLSLSRVFHPSSGKWPFLEYHSSKDTPDLISFDRLEESVDAVLAMIDRLERNYYPINLFRGEVFCSRYNMHVDGYKDPDGHRRLFDVMDRIDGTKTVSDIADACGVSFVTVLETLRQLESHELVRRSYTPVTG